MAPSSPSHRLLIIADSLPGQALRRHLKADFLTALAVHGSVGLRKVTESPYDIVLLAGHTDDSPLIGLCSQLRQTRRNLIIIVLLDHNDVTTKISVLAAGADTCLYQPINYAELKATSLALLRWHPQHRRETLRYHDLELDTASRRVSRSGQTIQLTPKQYTVLECLLRYAEHTISREALSAAAWDTVHVGWNPTIDVHISTLRSKIDRPFATPLIKTIRGYGYRLSTD